MKRILSNKILLILSRTALALVFIYAGAEKINAPEVFAQSIENYRIFPVFSINLIALTIPWLELIVGIFILFGISIKECSFIFNILLTFFILLILIAVIRELDIECGCFGTTDGNRVGIIKIIENLLLLLLGIHIFLFHPISNLFSHRTNPDSNSITNG